MQSQASSSRGRRALAVLAGLTALSAPLAAEAHRSWLAPANTNFSGDDPWVAVDAAVSNELFYADHRPMNLDSVTAIAPDGQKLPIENGVKGRYRSTFDVHLTQPGTTRIFVLNSNVGGTYVVDGQTYRVGAPRGGMGGGEGGSGPGPQSNARPAGQRQGPGPAPAQGPGPGGPPGGGPRALQGVADPAQIPANATDIKLVQSTSRNETFVTRGAPTALKPTGVGLELAETSVHPTDLVADEAATFRLLMDGKPAAGVEVTIVAADQRFAADVPADIKVKTDAQGAFTVKWPTAGFYWLNATAEGGAGSIPHSVRRASYTATLEVQKP